MSTSRRHLPLVLGLLGLSVTATGCPDDPPTPKLFEEDGAWAVISYDLEGSGSATDIDNNNRGNAFMLSFDAAEKVVTAAACVQNDTDTPANSTCRLTPGDTHWLCSCFAYDYRDTEMLWRPFDVGEVPPTVSLSEAGDPGGGGGSGGAEPTDDTYIVVSEVPDVNDTYNFRPLPDGVFGSNGESSRYVFQTRAPSIFDDAFDDPDGRPTCEPCVP